MTANPQTTPPDDNLEYLKRMGCEPDAGDIANKIIRMIADGEETDYYATKYGRRMIDALVEIKCRERGCIW